MAMPAHGRQRRVRPNEVNTCSIMKLEATSADFSDEQKRYLEGFMSGVQLARVNRGGGFAAAPATPVAAVDPEPVGPDAAGLKAQDKAIRDGRKLSDPEKFKREQHPFDAYQRLNEQARSDSPPSPADNFRWPITGCFTSHPRSNPSCVDCASRTAS